MLGLWTPKSVRAALAMAGVLLLMPAIALARAGGGQHYGGSGGGGGFGGSPFGGGGLWALWPLFLLGHGNGFGGIIFLFIVLYVIRRLRRRSTGFGGLFKDDDDDDEDRARGRSAGPDTVVADVPRRYDPDRAAAGIAAIKAKDPLFDERAFLDRAQTTFFKIQQAWAARNQDIARDCMSDALYERHKLQTDQLIATHRIDVLENIVIGNAHIIDASAGAAYDSIAVAFTASMNDYTVDEKTRELVDGDRYRRTFTEFWTFIRRAGARSTAGQTSLGSTCASCGAPLTLTQGKCAYCGSYASASAAGWVVDTIEQP